MIITDNEKIVIDIPKLAEGESETQAGRKALPAVITAAVFIIISLIIHSAIITESIDLLKAEGSDFLFSVLIPDYEISKPLTPVLPEGDSIENDGDRDKPDVPSFTVLSRDLSTKAEYGLSLTNETLYTPDLYQLLGSDRPSLTEKEIDEKHESSSPKVLIYHTHATESYDNAYGTGFRSSDEESNMIAVGKVITAVLEKAGIETVHITEQFDRDNWSESYNNSNAAVRKMLEQYPSIEYVFDVHRDCIGNEDEGYVRATVPVYGKDTAQLMFVCGTDEGGSTHTEWRQNLTTAVKLQASLSEKHKGLMRPINLRRASFYQDSSPSALILECGTCAGSLTEAKRAAILFAVSLADYIKGYDCALDCEELVKSLCP